MKQSEVVNGLMKDVCIMNLQGKICLPLVKKIYKAKLKKKKNELMMEKIEKFLEGIPSNLNI